jgi:uncharacterized membrane protein YoaK (UPF0700 family)
MVAVRINLPQLQSVLAGYVDTVGFLALQGLFTAHVTGNFVTLAASLVHGASGAAAKLLALPAFCAVIIATRLASFRLPRLGLPILTTMLAFETALLAGAAALAIRFGPFRDPDVPTAIATGIILVSAMAIQNAAHRIHYSASPPTTLMTGATTQVMIDLADLLRPASAGARAEARSRLGRIVPSVAAFAFGGAAGAALFAFAGMWCFAVPPLLALVSLTPPMLRSVSLVG